MDAAAVISHGEEAPETVNPSLWRQAQLNAIHGLFQVSDRVYQVRGMDLSNMTIIEGASGLILIDPLISTETARAALDQANADLARAVEPSENSAHDAQRDAARQAIVPATQNESARQQLRQQEQSKDELSL